MVIHLAHQLEVGIVPEKQNGANRSYETLIGLHQPPHHCETWDNVFPLSRAKVLLTYTTRIGKTASLPCRMNCRDLSRYHGLGTCVSPISEHICTLEWFPAPKPGPSFLLSKTLRSSGADSSNSVLAIHKGDVGCIRSFCSAKHLGNEPADGSSVPLIQVSFYF